MIDQGASNKQKTVSSKKWNMSIEVCLPLGVPQGTVPGPLLFVTFWHGQRNQRKFSIRWVTDYTRVSKMIRSEDTEKIKDLNIT